ncbi:GNAT family N-acetyltransferase [Sphingomonas montanisoli]|uniref:GNAT family N-acetyltransferase n=1 Tax=Sphingomonas montanisoli TaxID=2606412 RepID=A0A5D9C8V1_9SPHN|nr:GNAT family N-acetyltransferase [Sphingomonas montanisoli]TZG27582.1 GNAT family N-acetyltransferase [Sphingomonas montanisoli]
MTTAFDFAPILEGQCVGLRPLVPADRDALHSVAADPLIWEVHPTPTRWQRPVFDALFDDTMAEGGGMAIHDRATGALIGSSRFSVRYAEPGEAEIGWTFLARAHWGGAINRDVKRTMLVHAFRFVDRVIFRVGIDNIRSRRAMEKIGGIEIRRWRDPAKPHVPEHVVYAIDKAAFAAGPLA